MFNPRYQITGRIAQLLVQMGLLRKEITDLPLTPSVLASLRETAKIDSIHYSTKIEGNRLTTQEVEKVVYHQGQIEGKERDEKEVLGYYAALELMSDLVRNKVVITESKIAQLHGIVMGGGKKNCKPTPYRDGQNVIKDSGTGKIVYLPPEAHDVTTLMDDLVVWISDNTSLL
jgi:Fic family protein